MHNYSSMTKLSINSSLTNPQNIFQKSYIFPNNFIEIHEVSQKI